MLGPRAAQSRCAGQPSTAPSRTGTSLRRFRPATRMQLGLSAPSLAHGTALGLLGSQTSRRVATTSSTPFQTKRKACPTIAAAVGSACPWHRSPTCFERPRGQCSCRNVPLPNQCSGRTPAYASMIPSRIASPRMRTAQGIVQHSLACWQTQPQNAQTKRSACTSKGQAWLHAAEQARL